MFELQIFFFINKEKDENQFKIETLALITDIF